MASFLSLSTKISNIRYAIYLMLYLPLLFAFALFVVAAHDGSSSRIAHYLTSFFSSPFAIPLYMMPVVIATHQRLNGMRLPSAPFILSILFVVTSALVHVLFPELMVYFANYTEYAGFYAGILACLALLVFMLLPDFVLNVGVIQRKLAWLRCITMYDPPISRNEYVKLSAKILGALFVVYAVLGVFTFYPLLDTIHSMLGENVAFAIFNNIMLPTILAKNALIMLTVFALTTPTIRRLNSLGHAIKWQILFFPFGFAFIIDPLSSIISAPSSFFSNDSFSEEFARFFPPCFYAYAAACIIIFMYLLLKKEKSPVNA